MKPGPATAVDFRSLAAGSAATIRPASSRGLQRAARASPSATGHAKSPCRGSRARSITIGGTDSTGSSPRSRSLLTALATSASSPRFKDSIRRWAGRFLFSHLSPAPDRGTPAAALIRARWGRRRATSAVREGAGPRRAVPPTVARMPGGSSVKPIEAEAAPGSARPGVPSARGPDP